jgi:spore maturation protein CgeB
MGKKVEDELKKKTLMFAMWGSESKATWSYQWYIFLKKIFKEVELFDPRKWRIEKGSERMSERLFEIIREKQPDYFLFLIEGQDLGLDTIIRINEISPATITIAHFGDDDIHFEDRSRYYALFIDHCIVAQVDYISSYKREGLSNFSEIVPVNTEIFRPLSSVVKKKYDVSFIGQPLPSRIKTIRFLVENGVRVDIWGYGWEKYHEFKDLYRGPLEPEEMVKVINESKINLGFSKNRFNEGHLKGRVYEVGACRSFQLVDYYSGYLRHFKNNKEIVMFKDDEDLLKKTKYYLNNEKERESIADRMYKTVKKKYDLGDELKRIFGEIIRKGDLRRELPKMDKKIVEISRVDWAEDVVKKVDGADYVSFSSGEAKRHKYKNYLQTYGLEKTGKDISCCNYYVYSPGLGNYLMFYSLGAFRELEDKDFRGLVNLDQIVVRKDYFLRNIDKFKSVFEGGIVDFIEEESTAFVSLPLLQLEKLNRINRSKLNELDVIELEKAFVLRFLFNLQGLIHQKKVFWAFYPYRLVLDLLLRGERGVFNYLWKSGLGKVGLEKMRTA